MTSRFINILNYIYTLTFILIFLQFSEIKVVYITYYEIHADLMYFQKHFGNNVTPTCNVFSKTLFHALIG